ncbi:MAG: FhaA domain-containing protein, partial [Chloroflexota bacterium]
MVALADLEQLLERIFERTTARVFRARPQVVQVERKVERAMERARSTSGDRTSVPSRYRVRLRPDDLVYLAADAGGVDALAVRLADTCLSFARAHGYHLDGRPVVAVVADTVVERGAIQVDAVAAGRRPAPGPVPQTGVPDVPVVRARAQEGTPDAAEADATGEHGEPSSLQAAAQETALGICDGIALEVKSRERILHEGIARQSE